MDREVVIAQYWEKVGNNLVQLAEQFDSRHQVRHIQLQVVILKCHLKHRYSHTAHRYELSCSLEHRLAKRASLWLLMLPWT